MIQENNGILTFDQSDNVPNDVLFLRHGSMIYIVNEADYKLVCQFNPFDNTVFICEPRGYEIANLLGTKRFPVGAARKALNEDTANAVNAIQFPRDYYFPLNRPSQPLPEPLKITSSPRSYSELSEMLVRSSGFTPAKIDEYKKSGDIHCRFNSTNQLPFVGSFSCHIFIADSTKNDKTVGAMVADIILSPSGQIDVYFRDEIVESPCTLSDLFEAARTVVNKKLLSMNRRYQPEQATAVIRAAQGKEARYIELGCDPSSASIYVIHGPRTELAEAIDVHVKKVSIPLAASSRPLLRQHQTETKPDSTPESLSTDLNKMSINSKWN